MAHLTTRVECGKQFSSSLPECHHCGTSFYRGVRCGSCGKTLKKSEAVVEFGGYLHQDCFTQFKQSKQLEFEQSKQLEEAPPRRFLCPACKKQYGKLYPKEIFRGDRTSDGESNCRSLWERCSACGHTTILRTSREEWPYVRCHCHCNQLLYKKGKNTVRFPSPLDPSRDSSYAHRFCYEPHKKDIKEVTNRSRSLDAREEFKKSGGQILASCLTLLCASWLFFSLSIGWAGFICTALAVLLTISFIIQCFDLLLDRDA